MNVDLLSFERLKLKIEFDEDDFTSLFEKYSNLAKGNFEQFILVIHLVMLQNGFKCKNEPINKSTGFTILTYDSYTNVHPRVEIDLEQTKVKVVANLMKSINKMTIQVFYKNFKSLVQEFNKIQIDSSINTTTSKAYPQTLNKLINQFKDSILSPLKCFILKDKDLNELLIGKSIMYLPLEIIL